MKKYINQQNIKNSNTLDIFGLIKENGSITKKQLEAISGLSWGAVSNITARLLENNYITAIKQEGNGLAGRIPHSLEVDGESNFVLGIDINMSGFRGVLLNLRNDIIADIEKEITVSDAKALKNDIYSLVEEIISLAGERHILAAGIAMQGKVDAVNGISVKFPHCSDWSNVPLARDLTNRFGFPFFLEHDPDCVLYSALAQTSVKDAFLLRVDRDLGLSLVSGGEMMGKPGMLEVSHMCVELGGAKCSCSRNGCLRMYASSYGFEKRAGKKVSQIAKDAANGDKASIEMFKEMADKLALVACNLSKLFNSNYLVLCGKMLDYKDLFYDKLISRMNEISGEDAPETVTADIKNAAIGAAIITIEHTITNSNLL